MIRFSRLAASAVPALELNRAVMRQVRAPVQLEIVPGATELFEEPGALEPVSRLALEWGMTYLQGTRK